MQEKIPVDCVTDYDNFDSAFLL